MQTGEKFLGYTSFNTYVVVDKDFTFPEFKLVGANDEENYLISTYHDRLAKRKLNQVANQTLKDHIILN